MQLSAGGGHYLQKLMRVSCRNFSSFNFDTCWIFFFSFIKMEKPWGGVR